MADNKSFDTTFDRNGERTDIQVIFLLLPDLHVLDFAGPAQVFFEARALGADYRLRYCALHDEVTMAQGLRLAGLEPLPELGPGDLVIVPGVASTVLDRLDEPDRVPTAWLRQTHEAGATLCSICSAAHILAHAGLLEHRRCTTHWKVVDHLQRNYPRAKVLENRLFVRDDRIFTSAGVASGIDLALWLVEERHGPLMTARVARELVVYMRRDGASQQRSIYLDYRTHLHSGVHKVQDWLLANPETKATVARLADIANMSPRNLTRVFRQATGITLHAFVTRLKLEIAANLLRNPDLTVDGVAARCGFSDARQLRRLWKRQHGVAPGAWRQLASGE